MLHRKGWIVAALLSFATFVVVSHALAVIEKPLTLKSLVGDSDSVFIGKVTQLDPARPSMVIEMQFDVKGQPPVRRFPVLLKGEDSSGKEQILPRLAVGSVVIGFVTRTDDQAEGTTVETHIALVYFEGTWIQIQGTRKDADYRWQYTHAEPYLRRTFNGRSSELADLVDRALLGKTPWPDVQTSVKPGLGPTIGEPGNPKPAATAGADSPAETASGSDSHDPTTETPEPTTITGPIGLPMVLGIAGGVVLAIGGVVAWAMMQKPAAKENKP